MFDRYSISLRVADAGRTPDGNKRASRSSARFPEQRRGVLISRDRATLKAFPVAHARRRDQTWPARAPRFDLDAAALTVALDGHVHRLLDVLAGERGAPRFAAARGALAPCPQPAWIETPRMDRK